MEVLQDHRWLTLYQEKKKKKKKKLEQTVHKALKKTPPLCTGSNSMVIKLHCVQNSLTPIAFRDEGQKGTARTKGSVHDITTLLPFCSGTIASALTNVVDVPKISTGEERDPFLKIKWVI